MKEEDTIHIAYCTDSNYVIPTGISMISVCENNKNYQLLFHIIITEDNSKLDNIESKFVELENIAHKYDHKCSVYKISLEKLSEFRCLGSSYISTTAFARIFLPDLLEPSISKVLYLDCDTIVCDSLIELWQTTLGIDCPVGAVVDTIGNSVSIRSKVKTSLNVPYCNSGVLLMNLDCWRREQLTKRIVDCAVTEKYPFLDQDSLHVVLGKRTKMLPVKYNVQTNLWFEDQQHWLFDYSFLEEVKEAMTNPTIIHYISANKPWKDQYCPKSDVWDKYKEMSIWRNLKKEHVEVRFEKTIIYNDFIDAYWSNSVLFVNSLKCFVRCFKISMKFKNKIFFLNLINKSIGCYSYILETIYSKKKKEP